LKPEEADAAILGLALDHHLVTRLTSLVAVDKTPRRPDGARLTRAELPLNLPAGWEFDKLFGEPPAPLPPDTRRAGRAQPTALTVASFRAVATSALPRPAGASAAKGIMLPKTATDAELRMALGLALIAISLMLVVIGRRPRRIPVR
jgi:Ca-activated chloride channel family protein